MSDDGYIELTGDNLPYHLRPDAQGARCSRCGRTTWAEDAWGGLCDFPQPDGSRCTGSFPWPADVPAVTSGDAGAQSATPGRGRAEIWPAGSNPGAAAVTERCESCVHWENPWVDEYGSGPIPLDAEPKWGVCRRIGLPTWQRDERWDDELWRNVTTTPPPVTAFTMDASDCKADLNTHAAFGCVLHEPKENT